MTDDAADCRRAVDEIAGAWRFQRPERQSRRHLDPADLALLRDAGILALPCPVAVGGAWVNATQSARPLCELYRALARADPSVALASSMHPAVIMFWLASPDPSQPAWERQREAVFADAMAGQQWGTITSEPGSGGDISRTRSVAAPADPCPFLVGDGFQVTGEKHFGSGFGITDRMMTTAIATGETEPMIYVIDVKDRPWDGSAGLQLTAAWDGMGMAATQSHAMRLDQVPAVRMAWDGPLAVITRAAGPVLSLLFTGVVLGVLDEAVTTARAQIQAKAAQLRPYEQVEWTKAEMEHWLAVQAYEGALRTLETGSHTAALHAASRAKQSVAGLAERSLSRLSRVLGGGTYSQRSPFAHWFEDVRALGFLRPPWALAFDGLFATSLDAPI